MMPNCHKILNKIFIISTAVLAGCSKFDSGPRKHISAEETLTKSGLTAGSRTLPVLFVRTADGKGIRDRDQWSDAVLSLYTPDGAFDLDGTAVRVKGRGNSSWYMPKKPFDIRFAEPAPVLGMEPASRWCLLANWRDPTLMRNAVSLEMARMTSLEWTPAGRFVEVVTDGEFQGNYYLTERVDIAENHVNVGLDGFLVCIDSYYDGTFRFRTALRNLPVNILTPAGCTLDQDGFQDIRDCLNAAERALYSREGDWRDLLDAESFCDWYIVHELTGNDEPARLHGIYLHRKAGGKLTAGPCWDFDYHTFRPGIEELVDREAFWLDALLQDAYFCSVLRERWAALRPAFAAKIPAYVEETCLQIEASAELNRQMWPISGHVNGDEKLSFEEAVQRMQKAFGDRLAALDIRFAELP